MCVWAGGRAGGRVGLLPNKCYWCMDVLLREHKMYVDTVKLITNIKIFCRKRQNLKPYFKTALQIFHFNGQGLHRNIQAANSTNLLTKALQ